MKSKKLLIVFAKNILLGKVKTRLAKSIGDFGAFEVYKHLVEITEKQTSQLRECDIRIYWSDIIIGSKWKNAEHKVQEGEALGDRMSNAFEEAFKQGYERVVGIGSDLADLTKEIMEEAFTELERKDVVFGPSEDGGYYLIGMSSFRPQLFQNKEWSTDSVLEDSIKDVEENGWSMTQLKTLNDIDTIEDLKASSVANKFKHLYELSRSNK